MIYDYINSVIGIVPAEIEFVKYALASALVLVVSSLCLTFIFNGLSGLFNR